jgi:hypothetical protein
MRKSVRVATVFTGAAACTAALAPTAQAAVVTPGARATTIPDITGGNCHGSSNSVRVQLVYSANQHHSTNACFSGTGYYIIGGAKRFAYYYGGDWSGILWIDGSPRRFTHGHVYHQLYGASVSAISIQQNIYG